jgi:hypothetical protein
MCTDHFHHLQFFDLTETLKSQTAASSRRKREREQQDSGKKPKTEQKDRNEQRALYMAHAVGSTLNKAGIPHMMLAKAVHEGIQPAKYGQKQITWAQQV